MIPINIILQIWVSIQEQEGGKPQQTKGDIVNAVKKHMENKMGSGGVKFHRNKKVDG